MFTKLIKLFLFLTVVINTYGMAPDSASNFKRHIKVEYSWKMANMEKTLVAQGQVLLENRDFIVTHLDAEDIIDELIQERLMGRSAAQRVQLAGSSRMDKNRIICEQLSTAGPDAVCKFCKILRNGRRQSFIAERLEECESCLGDSEH